MSYSVNVFIDDFVVDEKGLINSSDKEKWLIVEEKFSTKNEVAYFLEHFNLSNSHCQFFVYNEKGENETNKFIYLPYGSIIYEER